MRSRESKKDEKELHKNIINGVIEAKSSKDLKVLLDLLNGHRWADATRKMFLLGLLQGALMQFMKDVSSEELKKIFYEK